MLNSVIGVKTSFVTLCLSFGGVKPLILVLILTWHTCDTKTH